MDKDKFTIPIDQRSLGCNFDTSGNAHVRVWAPGAEKITLEVNGKDKLPLEKEDYGFWNLVTDQINPGDKYFINLDSEGKFPDPASLSQPNGVHGPSLAVNLNELKWNDSDWEGLTTADMVFYELHVGTFSEEGNFQGVINKLDYLIELGITAIEIMPVSQFPGNRNWGYDGVCVYAVQDSYGGFEGFKELIEACHKRGIAVILDVVYNHNGPEGNYLPKFGPYFTSKYQIPWGNAINFDDAYCDGVRQYYIENALMWYRDFHIDALRLDAVHAIKDLSANHFLAELSGKVQELSKMTGRQHVLIGECDLNDVRYIDPVDKRGFGLDAQWCDEFHHALHAYATGEKLEYYADFGDINQILKTIKDAYIYDGIYSPHRKRIFGTSTGSRPGDQFVVFIQNHDQTGNRMLGERLSVLIDFERLKLLAGVMFISPYIPLLFMGEEYGETNPFLYFNSHSDPDLIDMVRTGRKNEFKEFFSQGEPADPQDEETFQRSRLSWSIDNDSGRRAMLEYYKRWIRLRKENQILKDFDRRNIEVEQIRDKAIIVVKRKKKNQGILAILNFEEESQLIRLHQNDISNAETLIYSAASEWDGPVKFNPLEESSSNEIIINAHSILVIQHSL